jgi:hypothetical protein
VVQQWGAFLHAKKHVGLVARCEQQPRQIQCASSVRGRGCSSAHLVRNGERCETVGERLIHGVMITQRERQANKLESVTLRRNKKKKTTDEQVARTEKSVGCC